MRILEHCESIDREIARLISECESCRVAVAWASIGFRAYELLLSHGSKITRMVVGTEFYQTHPEFIGKFLPNPNVRFVLETDGVFHPKVYFFEMNDGRWECVVGSANFTKGGFGLNSEVAVLLTDRDEGAEDARRQLIATIDRYWEVADHFGADEYYAYSSAWKNKQQLLNRLRGKFGDANKEDMDDHGKPPLAISILKMSWPSYLNAVKSEQLSHLGHTVYKRLQVISTVRQLFQSQQYFRAIDKLGRQMIAGTAGIHDGVDYGFFGSMIGNGKFKNVINENDEHISAALDHIPFTGGVSPESYRLFIDEFLEAFPEGRGGIATATRLLCMKRPDVFVCFDGPNSVLLCKEFGVSRTMTFEKYWDSIVMRIMDATWWCSSAPKPTSDETEKTVWSARAAFLDSLFYDSSHASLETTV